MTKKLNDILKGVKSSKTETPNLKDIYNWEGGKSGEDFIKKHKIEKHEDRVGNDDEVYKSKTKPAKYPRQSDSVYEESEDIDEAKSFSYGYKKPRKGTVAHEAMMKRKKQEKEEPVIEPKDQMVGNARVIKSKSQIKEADCSCSDSKTSCDVHGKKKKMLLDKDMKEAAVTPRNKESNPFSNTTGSNTAKETTPKSETATTPKKSLKEVLELDEARDKFRTALAYDKEGKMTGGISVRSNRQALKLLKRTHPDKKERVTVKLFKGETPSPTDSGRISKSKLAKEDVELDEISRKLAGNYAKKSSRSALSHTAAAMEVGGKAPEYKKLEKHIDKRVKGHSLAINKLSGNAKVNATEDVEINEVAPPNPKIEKWIKSNKDNFIKEYGRKKGMEVLYAKAWKMHNEQSGSPATNTDYAGPGAAGWTTGRMDTGTL